MLAATPLLRQNTPHTHTIHEPTVAPTSTRLSTTHATQHFKSSVVFAENSPRWGTKFDFVMITMGSTLHITVYNKASATANLLKSVNIFSKKTAGEVSAGPRACVVRACVCGGGASCSVGMGARVMSARRCVSTCGEGVCCLHMCCEQSWKFDFVRWRRVMCVACLILCAMLPVQNADKILGKLAIPVKDVVRNGTLKDIFTLSVSVTDDALLMIFEDLYACDGQPWFPPLSACVPFPVACCNV